MPLVGWHIAVELSVSQSVRPAENFNGHNFFNIEHSNLIFIPLLQLLIGAI
jgi:hypothetical protein